MIRLKRPLNYRGGIIAPGEVVSYLPADLQEKLLKTGAAEKVAAEEKEEKPADGTKEEKPINEQSAEEKERPTEETKEEKSAKRKK